MAVVFQGLQGFSPSLSCWLLLQTPLYHQYLVVFLHSCLIRVPLGATNTVNRGAFGFWGFSVPIRVFFCGHHPISTIWLPRKRALYHQYLPFSLASFLIQGLLCMYNAASIAALALQGFFVVQQFFGSVTQPLTISHHPLLYPLLQKD